MEQINLFLSVIFGFCFMLGTVALYGWLYASKYKLKITEEEIVVQTLFKKTLISYNINAKDFFDFMQQY